MTAEYTKVTVIKATPDAIKADLLVACFFLYQPGEVLIDGALALDRGMQGQVSALRKNGDFKGAAGETLLLYPPSPQTFQAQRVLLVGLGDKASVSGAHLFRAGSTMALEALKLNAQTVAFAPLLRDAGVNALDGVSVTRAVVSGALSAAARSFNPDGTLVSGLTELIMMAGSQFDTVEIILTQSRIIGEAEALTRAYTNLPQNLATPTYTANLAQAIAERLGLKYSVFNQNDFDKQNFKTLSALSANATTEPQFIVLEYNGADATSAPIALIGKGVSGDTLFGKYDKAGAGAVLGLLTALASLKLKVNVVGIIPALDVSKSYEVVRPGDKLDTYAGSVIEVGEGAMLGNLVLVDALAYAAQHYKPALLIDIATTIRASLGVLGESIGVFMTTDSAIANQVVQAGQLVSEHWLQVPFFDDYYSVSPNADGQPITLPYNIKEQAATTIRAGLFLRQFTDGLPYLHFDIGSTASSDGSQAYSPAGATGRPTSTLLEWLQSTYSQ